MRKLVVQVLVDGQSDLQVLVERLLDKLVDGTGRVVQGVKSAALRDEEGSGMCQIVGSQAPAAHTVARAVVTVPVLVLPDIFHLLLKRIPDAVGAELAATLVAGLVLDVQVLVKIGTQGLRLS